VKDSTKLYFVFEGDKMITWYNEQAPATTVARSRSRYSKTPIEVIEVQYARVGQQKVRTCIDGQIFKEPKCS
jgi:hypothetical protein